MRRAPKPAHKDSLELVRKYGTKAKYDEVCGGTKKHTEKCLQECGG
jgi:hypothetical protein